MSRLLRPLPAVFVVLLVGCQTYQADPLLPEEVLREIERARDLPEHSVDPAGSGPVAPDFAQVASWVLENSPALREARAEAATARALAEIETPLPDPTLGFGPLYGVDLAPGAPNRLVPFVEFGFTLPLSGRLGYQDEVNDLLAREAEARVVVAHRRAYLRLRQLCTERILTRRRLLAQAELVESARRSAALTRRLVEAGGASALDVGLMDLEVGEAEKELLVTRAREAELTAELAALTGVRARHLGEPAAAPELPPVSELPDLGRAKELLLANHSELALLRARYAVAEKNLRLEIARQVPDLVIGPSYEGDPGDEKQVLGLTLGISLPVFDRNQQGIAQARHDREKTRVKYEATLGLALASLEGLFTRQAFLVERQRLLQEVVLPRAAANVEVAVQSIRAGALDALRLLEVDRRQRALRIEALEVEELLRHMNFEIEQLIGWPLAPFPGEAAGDYPSYPSATLAPREPALPDEEDQ